MQVQRRRLVPGLILILLGIALLLREYFEIGPGLILILAALIFIVPYMFTRWYGLLIPGMILLGLGIGLLVERGLRTSATVPFGLGLGFIAIFVTDFVATRMVRWWPLIPGGILVLVGLVDASPEARTWLERGWPVILILGGLLILARDFTQKNQPKAGA